MEGKRVRGPYAGAGVSEETKGYAAQLAVALNNAGVSIDVFVAASSETDYPVKKRTLEEHIARLRAQQPLFTEEKQSGRPPKLTDEQWFIVCGAILSQSFSCADEWVQAWIQANFVHKLDPSTISRHLCALRMTVQLTGSRPLPKGESTETLVQEYFETVQGLHQRGFFKHPRNKLLCLDFVTDSQRIERTSGRNISGSAQKKFARYLLSHTNSFLVPLLASGDRVFEVIMFTHDPTFDPTGKRWPEVKRWCKKLGIELWRIVYTHSQKKYCKEQSAQVAHFKQLYKKELEGMRVIIDGGNSFKIGGNQILEEVAEEVFVLPSMSHGLLSPCDNNANGVAKQKWRSERPHNDPAHVALHLMACFDWETASNIQHYWDRNFFLGRAQLTLPAVEDLVKRRNKNKDVVLALEEKYVGAYAEWKEENVEEVPSRNILERRKGLDGAYWVN